MKVFNKKVATGNLVRIIVLVILYVLLGNIPQIQQNPIIRDATLAVNMIIVVLAGVLFGRKVGLSVGLFGTFFNALSPAGNAFEFAAIVPHIIMGWTAGALKENTSVFWGSLAIILGHLLNILVFLMAGLITLGVISSNTFWYGLGFEALLGIVSVNIIVFICRLIGGKDKGKG
jgi:LytS/YehU family sensor histidine kinase